MRNLLTIFTFSCFSKNFSIFSKCIFYGMGNNCAGGNAFTWIWKECCNLFQHFCNLQNWQKKYIKKLMSLRPTDTNESTHVTLDREEIMSWRWKGSCIAYTIVGYIVFGKCSVNWILIMQYTPAETFLAQ